MRLGVAAAVGAGAGAWERGRLAGASALRGGAKLARAKAAMSWLQGRMGRA